MNRQHLTFNNLKKRVFPVVLALVLVSAMAPVPAFAMDPDGEVQMPGFEARLEEPSRDTSTQAKKTPVYRYYHSKANPYNKRNSMIGSGGNCTAYAYGRAFELLKKRPILPDCSQKYGRSDGGNWFNWNKKTGAYPTGMTPRLGAIACWQSKSGGTGGHVAVVEKIMGDTIVLSESGYGSFYFRTRELQPYQKPNTDQLYSCGNYKFVGFIYVI